MDSLVSLRRQAVARSLFAPLPLAQAIDRLGFVQADPIRAPARAQDLILRQRVRGYREGDLERRYPALELEEDVLHNYGFLPRRLQALLHPRRFDGQTRAERHAEGLAEAVLDFVRRHGPTHPKALEAELGAQRYANYWGGQSKATTGLLDSLHYRGQLRVLRRDKGIRVYTLAEPAADRLDADERFARLARLILDLYAPLPTASFRQLLGMLDYGVPQLSEQIGRRAETIARWGEQGWLIAGRIDGEEWLWPHDETPADAAPRGVRLLAPFDPVVWDRRRFEKLWGWRYRFEAYTPAPKRQLGYYALPLLYGDQVIGWANLSATERLEAEIGLVATPPGGRGRFEAALGHELEKMAQFLALSGVDSIRWRE
ncbi:DNA glycosylase AlkZ-like family protein [Chitinimonas lacunae]|uniref:DNA glycosylase AlkZ-like family protein n=1 Tax=Chitinimonas lacunae TaxID=1963018 RepID=A0ABV8MIF8_9NEIS